ncbi:TPA: hypothetical protein LN609_003701 [Salmonella enterica subsp. enterica serovar Typhimurium]|nr:hypothetical protein [Salmonella enterica subsp. enterica serovar Typhimurium]HCR7628397.1 hypothetical protein [Shigella sonnei]HCR8479125.1 hypothetical protein [Shigella flexneri]
MNSVVEEVRLPLLARITELEVEVLRLRQQRDAANAQLDFIMENLKCDTLPEQNAS